MSRTNSAPTVGYVFSSQMYKWIAGVFFLLVLILTAITIRWVAILDAACTDDREIHVGKYSFYVTATTNKCKP